MNKGFAILYAVLMVGIVLTISLSIYNITFRQLVLSTVGRDSIFATAAAENGLACARHWASFEDPDGAPNPNPFGFYYIDPIDDTESHFVEPQADRLTCGQMATLLPRYQTSPDNGTTIYNVTPFIVGFPMAGNTACARVEVRANRGGRGTIITSRGYNFYDDRFPEQCPREPISPRTVERGVVFQ